MIRDTLKKAAGLFIEFDQDPNSSTADGTEKPAEEWNVMTADAPQSPSGKARTVEEIVKQQPGPNLDEIKIPDSAAAPITTPSAAPVIRDDGSINFDSIYQLANLPSVPFTAEQILDLFSNLPEDLPLESKRATIKVTLGAMAKTLGVTTEQIVSDASRKLAALASYNESFTKQAADYCTKAEVDIMSLEQQIAERKKSIEQAKLKQTKMNENCVKESDRLDDVLEFFSLDVPPSKLAK